MMRQWKGLGKNHKGFSLVELLCTIAIFSIVIVGVGTAMVVSARSYQNGSVELDLQQQAQITSNLLTNLIIDSDRVVEASGSRLVLEKMEAGVLVSYEVQLESDGAEGYRITYTSNGASGVLAENVTASGFSVSQDDGGNVDFTLGFKEGTREYESVYHVTPRNGVTSGGVAATGTASLFLENDIVLEPGEVYDLNVRVLGTPEQGFTIEGLTEGGITDTTGTKVDWRDTDSSLDVNTARITVGLGETSEVFHFQVKPKDSSVAPQNVNVWVRRVNAINVNGYKTGGTTNKMGLSYKVTASLAGRNLERIPGAWYDVNYVNPYAVAWTYEFTKNGVSLNAMNYIEITGQGMEGNVPYITFRLKQDMTEGCKLKITATALHPEGKDPVDLSIQTNKSGEKYDTVSGFWELRYQAWRRNGKLDISVGEMNSNNYWITIDGKKQCQREASVTIIAYDYWGNVIEENTMNSWTQSVDGMVTALITDTNDYMNHWQLVLDPERPNPYGTPERNQKSYSTPYKTMYPTELPTGDYFVEQYNYPGITHNDTHKFKIIVNYQEVQEDGSVINRKTENEYFVEDVSIKYKRTQEAPWERDIKIFVTEKDNMTDYKIYFMFDRGWEGEDYYFHDSRRFVGVVHDDIDDRKDVRKDINVVCPKTSEYHAGDTYITFTLSAEDKKECLKLSESYGGIITETYEYNPIFAKLNKIKDTTSEFGFILGNYPEYYYGSDIINKEKMDQIKGCEGTVIFCFKTPNVTVPDGVPALKAMYCPTIAENGGNQFYYIDDTTRYNLLGAIGPEYQEWSGSAWVTTHQLIGNSISGWTTN